MPRNQEVIRQWKVLHALEASRHGVTIDSLSKDLDVTTRTIPLVTITTRAPFASFGARAASIASDHVHGSTGRCSGDWKPDLPSRSCARSI